MNRIGRTKGLLWQKAVTKVVTIGLKMDLVRSKTMRSRKQEGFSLIELLCVVVIIGVIAALAVPALMKARLGAENGTTFATLRSVNSTEVSFFSSNGRFARLSEVNPIMSNGIGALTGNQIIRGKYFVFEMTPANPTDQELKDGFVITARRAISTDSIYQYELTQTGEIKQIFP
jgi:prepilin-type N-terminal cleavage/methylation domain-containing protein